MGRYQSASILFEQMRVLSLAIADGAPLDGLNPQNVPATPPHIPALGPEGSGKTTKTLINYAARGEPWGRGEWSLILVKVDLGDVGDLGVTLRLEIPPSSGVRGLSRGAFPPPLSTPLSTPTSVCPSRLSASTSPTVWSSSALTPLTYWYSHAEMQRNPVLLERIIRNPGTRVRERLEADPKG